MKFSAVFLKLHPKKRRLMVLFWVLLASSPANQIGVAAHPLDTRRVFLPHRSISMSSSQPPSRAWLRPQHYHRHLSREMPWTTSLDSSTPRRNGAPVKERVTGVSHVADDPANPRAKGRAVLPSSSPSSIYYTGDKRRQNKSPSPERTEQQKKDLKKRKLNKQSCSYCNAEKQNV